MQRRPCGHHRALNRHRAIVAQNLTAVVGDAAARFLHDEIACGQVPIVLARQRDRGIEKARADERQAIGDRIALLDVHGRPGHIGRARPGGMFEQRLGRQHAAAFDGVARARMRRLAVQRRTVAGLRAEAFVRDGIEYDGRDRPSVFDDGERVREMRFAFQEGDRAVDGIDDEGAPRGLARFIVDGFFRKPAVIGSRRRQSLAQITIDGEIGLGDGFAFALVPLLVGAAEIASRDFARALRGFGEQGEVVSFRQRSCLRRAAWARSCRSGTRDRWRARDCGTCLSGCWRWSHPPRDRRSSRSR